MTIATVYSCPVAYLQYGCAIDTTTAAVPNGLACPTNKPMLLVDNRSNANAQLSASKTICSAVHYATMRKSRAFQESGPVPPAVRRGVSGRAIVIIIIVVGYKQSDR